MRDKLLHKCNASGNTRDPVMRADRHHAATVGSFCVEDIKIILHILQIDGVRRGRRIKAHDVILSDCVGDDGEGLAFHRHGKRLILANVINVVDEAQVLENSQGIRCTAQPECIKANRTGAGDSLDGIDAGLIPGTFLLVLRFILG
jgi:hypothetical protein